MPRTPHIRCFCTLATALALALPPAASAAPDPIEHALFDAWIGKYRDLTAGAFYRTLDAPSSTKRLPFDVRKAHFYKDVVGELGLDRASKEALARDGVVLVDPGRQYSMAAAYWAIFTADLPLLVTTDSVLDAMHRSFDAMLSELEEQVLSPSIESALNRTRDRVAAMATEQPALRETAGDVDLYLTVALSLLSQEPVSPLLSAKSAVNEIRAKIAGRVLENPGTGGPSTRLYGSERAIDYSQFKPRGHYTKTPELERYFLALMWLGRADTGFEISRPRQLRAAALLSDALRGSGAEADLDAVRDVIDLMVGGSDELTPKQLNGLMDRERLTPAKLLEASAVARLSEQLAITGLGQQRIASQLVVSDPRTAEQVPPPSLFQLFGQRFIIDSFVLSKVVYDNILFDGVKQDRRMPTGLDVMAALGNDLAARLLRPELEKWRYAANLETLREIIAGYTEDHWQGSLYTLWLDALRTLDDAPTGRYAPATMQREAWGRKMLQTQLGSWSQLRHDTILYAKQSYTISVGCLYPKGYVEPYPAFYDKLERFGRVASTRFARLKLAGGRQYVQRYVAWFDGFAGHMKTLGTLARKQLAGQPFSKAEEAFLGDTIEVKVTGGYNPKPAWDGWYMDLLYIPMEGAVADAVDWKPEIADVHTDPDAQQVLEVGTGGVHLVVAAIDNDGDRAVHVGPSFTYYEFTNPASNRLTDEQWSSRLQSPETTPARPAWITPLVVKGQLR